MNLESGFTCLILSHSCFDRWDKIIGETTAVMPITRFYPTCSLFFLILFLCTERLLCSELVTASLCVCVCVLFFAFVFLLSCGFCHSEVHLSEKKPAALVELAVASCRWPALLWCWQKQTSGLIRLSSITLLFFFWGGLGSVDLYPPPQKKK